MKEGYKKTELGWIPEEWELSNLIDIAEINPKKEVFYSEKEVSFIAMEHVSNSGRVLNMETRNYSDVFKGYTAFKDNDVLLAKITPCFENGKKAIVKNLKNGYGFGSTEFHVLRSKDERSIPEFLYYYVSTYRFRQQAELNMTGSAGQRRVPTTFLNDNRLVVPPLKEQQKIAEILSTVDSQIDDTDKLIEKAKELKKGLMQRLLTKGIGHTKFKMTEVGEIPVEWEVKAIGEVGKFVGGYAFKSSDYVGEGVKLIKITNVQQNNLVWDEKDRLPEEYLDAYANYKMKKDDVVMAMTRPIISTGLKVCILKESDLPCLLNQRVGKFEVDNRIDNKFLYQYTFTIYFINKVKELSSTTGQPNISSSQVESILMPIPTIEEQKEIADILSSVDTQIEEYENNKAKLEELKKALMQQLLTGKIRVRV